MAKAKKKETEVTETTKPATMAELKSLIVEFYANLPESARSAESIESDENGFATVQVSAFHYAWLLDTAMQIVETQTKGLPPELRLEALQKERAEIYASFKTIDGVLSPTEEQIERLEKINRALDNVRRALKKAEAGAVAPVENESE